MEKSQCRKRARIVTSATTVAHVPMVLHRSLLLLSTGAQVLMLLLSLLLLTLLQTFARVAVAAADALRFRTTGPDCAYLGGFRRRGPPGRRIIALARAWGRGVRTMIRRMVQPVANPVKVPAGFPHSKSGNMGPGSPRRATAMLHRFVACGLHRAFGFSDEPSKGHVNDVCLLAFDLVCSRLHIFDAHTAAVARRFHRLAAKVVLISHARPSCSALLEEPKGIASYERAMS